jgi:general secretion pathway protein D
VSQQGSKNKGHFMKRLVFSIAAAAMVMCLLYIFGTMASRLPLPAAVIAQEPAKPVASVDPFAADDSPRRPHSTAPENRGPNGADQQSKPTSAKSSGVGSSPSEAIEAKLSKEENLEYPDIPLQEVIDQLQIKLGIPIVIDKKALEDAGIGTDKTVNVLLKGIRMDRALDLILGELELAWVVRDGYVLVTTVEKLDELLEVRVYNCSDLLESVKEPPKAPEGGFGGGSAVPAGAAPGGHSPGASAPGSTFGSPNTTGGQAPDLVPDFDSLITLIQTTLEPDSWQPAGGHGSIEPYHGGLLVINQNGQTHRRIEKLLNMMRQARKAEPGAVIRER